MFRSQKIAGTGLKATRGWMNVISNNIANANTLDTGKKDKFGNYVPYAREVPVFAKVLSDQFRTNKVNGDVKNGVRVDEIIRVTKNNRKVFDPSHPAARRSGSPDAGYVYYPGVSISQEMADLKVAAATYEANITVISVSNKMIQQALTIGRK